MLNFFWPFVTAFLTVLTVTPLVIRLAYRLRLIDDPRYRPHPAHIHKGIVPRAGGLALLTGIYIPVVLFLPITKPILGILLAGIATVVIGVFDDRRDLSPYLRFLGNIATALLVVGAGLGIPFITNPLGGVLHLDTLRFTFEFLGTHSVLVLADILAVLWIVWTMNIVGWSSGVDGQMPGFVAIAAVIMGIHSLKFSAHDLSHTTVATLAFITAGSFLGFLPWNFYPQKIMPGYGGKTLAGLLLATLAILSGTKVGSALLILAIPMLDAAYALLRRLIGGRSPFKADRSHLHHRLLALGWGKRRIAIFYWSVSALLGTLALTLSRELKIFTFLAVSVSVGAVLVWLSFVFRLEVPEAD